MAPLKFRVGEGGIEMPYNIEHKKEWRKNNIEHKKEYDKKRYQQNKESLTKQTLTWRENNIERYEGSEKNVAILKEVL
tara:strand:- start:67 stop:300 length:234 start_codon:yes stop_codon:yes gene_type:complete